MIGIVIRARRLADLYLVLRPNTSAEFRAGLRFGVNLFHHLFFKSSHYNLQVQTHCQQQRLEQLLQQITTQQEEKQDAARKIASLELKISKLSQALSRRPRR